MTLQLCEELSITLLIALLSRRQVCLEIAKSFHRAQADRPVEVSLAFLCVIVIICFVVAVVDSHCDLHKLGLFVVLFWYLNIAHSEMVNHFLFLFLSDYCVG